MKNQVNNLTEENSRKIKVFGNDEDSLKTLGQLLSNETSRKIISCLNGNEMYINQISKACDIQMNLVIHHIKKLEEVGLVTITEKPIIRKGVDHKFYKMIPNVFVNTIQTKEEMKEKGIFKKFFKDGIKFATVGIASIVTLFLTNYDPNKIKFSRGSSEVNTTFNLLEDSINFEFTYFSIIVTLSVILVGTFLIYKLKKNKKN